jgi:hypothetical protein
LRLLLRLQVATNDRIDNWHECQRHGWTDSCWDLHVLSRPHQS